MPLSKIILGYTSYRLETLPFVRDKMLDCQCVILEEPPTPGFAEMLRQDMSIDDYLMLTDFGFPKFAREQCGLLQYIHSRAKIILQVEPFLEELACIHEFFASGGSPEDIPKGTKSREVYDCERIWTASLMGFYRQAHNSDFFRVLRAVQDFARTDALKGRLRDTMRAEALKNLFSEYDSIYVEAGYIHFALLAELYKSLPTTAGLTTFFSLQNFFKSKVGKRQLMGPGDILTLIYTWNPDYSGPRADLLAARSLIYNKLVQKDELTMYPENFPQSCDEILAVRLADSLNLEQCLRLYPEIKSFSTDLARETVQDYLLKIMQ